MCLTADLRLSYINQDPSRAFAREIDSVRLRMRLDPDRWAVASPRRDRTRGAQINGRMEYLRSPQIILACGPHKWNLRQSVIDA
jgi:hypothetical protein